VAVTTACGALDNIVVDTVESGQRCIEFLKANNLGRATFICLDKIKKYDLSPITTPENVERLFDLIRPKEKRFAVAFYQVMHDTLVASDLKQASRIAYGKRRFRVVTLDGQLIDTSGTMSGGGTRAQKGGMSSKLAARDEMSPKALAKLEADETQLEEDVRRCEAERRAMETRLSDIETEIPALEMKVSKLGMVVQSLGKQVDETRKQISSLR
jgi:structural maintenance of chromosome 4